MTTSPVGTANRRHFLRIGSFLQGKESTERSLKTVIDTVPPGKMPAKALSAQAINEAYDAAERQGQRSKGQGREFKTIERTNWGRPVVL